MSSSSSQQNKEKEGMTPAAADLAETGKEGEEKPRRRMTQEQIDRLIRYESVHMYEDAFRDLSIRNREVLTPADLAYQGNLPVPMGQIHDYIADMFSEINESEAPFMRKRDCILNDYHAKGYAEEEASSPAAPVPAPVPAPVSSRHPYHSPGRRRFRLGVTKSKQAGKANKMVYN